VKNDITYLRMAIDLARKSMESGNLPFGCLLVDQHGEVLLTGENRVNTDKDCLAHAEVNLIREAGKIFDFSYLNSCTLFTSVEPCPMCASAIYWSGIGRLVYALAKTKYYDIAQRENPNWVFEMPVRELMEKGGRKVAIVGPLLQMEAYDAYLQMLKT